MTKATDIDLEAIRARAEHAYRLQIEFPNLEVDDLAVWDDVTAECFMHAPADIRALLSLVATPRESLLSSEINEHYLLEEVNKWRALHGLPSVVNDDGKPMEPACTSQAENAALRSHVAEVDAVMQATLRGASTWQDQPPAEVGLYWFRGKVLGYDGEPDRLWSWWAKRDGKHLIHWVDHDSGAAFIVDPNDGKVSGKWRRIVPPEE